MERDFRFLSAEDVLSAERAQKRERLIAALQLEWEAARRRGRIAALWWQDRPPLTKNRKVS